jgi:hypothetical protein
MIENTEQNPEMIDYLLNQSKNNDELLNSELLLENISDISKSMQVNMDEISEENIVKSQNINFNYIYEPEIKVKGSNYTPSNKNSFKSKKKKRKISNQSKRKNR